jgi:FAD synthase
MTIILGRNDQASDVLLHIFDESYIIPGNKVTISFHKKIHGAINFSDSRSISKINQAMEEISDLIY